MKNLVRAIWVTALLLPVISIHAKTSISDSIESVSPSPIVQKLNNQHEYNRTHENRNYVLLSEFHQLDLSTEEIATINAALNYLHDEHDVDFYILLSGTHLPSFDFCKQEEVTHCDDQMRPKYQSYTQQILNQSEIGKQSQLSFLLNIDSYVIPTKQMVRFVPTLVVNNASFEQVKDLILTPVSEFTNQSGALIQGLDQVVQEWVIRIKDKVTCSDVSPALETLVQQAIQCNNDFDDDDNFEGFSDEDYTKLCAEQRIKVVHCLAEGWASGSDEDRILQVLAATPENQRLWLLNKLFEDKVYELLVSSVDGNNFLFFVKLISTWVLHNSGETSLENIVPDKFLFFNPNDGFLTSYDSNGDMVFKTRENFEFNWKQEIAVSPHEWVCVIFLGDFIVDGEEHTLGEMVTMTGLGVWSLFNESVNKQVRLTSAILMDVPLLFVGIGEIRMANKLVKVSRAIRALKYAQAATNTLIAAGGLAMAVGIEDELSMSEEGREILSYWSWFNIAYAGAALSPQAVKSATGLYKSCKKLYNRRSEISTSLVQHVEAWMKSIDDIFKSNGKNIQELVEGISKTQLLNKLDDLLDLKAWVNSMDELEDVTMLTRLDELSVVDLSKLNFDIVHASYGAEIKVLLKESPDDLVNIWKRLKDDPSYSWELSKTGNSRWKKWGQREFFKEITALGKKFEEETVLRLLKDKTSQWYNSLKNKLSTDFNKNLDDYDVFSQVQLKYDGESYFVADQVLVKFDEFGEIDDLIIIENKLKNSTALTSPQAEALGKSSYEVRSIEKSSELGTSKQIRQGDRLSFDGEIKWYKIFDSDLGEEISGINKL